MKKETHLHITRIIVLISFMFLSFHAFARAGGGHAGGGGGHAVTHGSKGGSLIELIIIPAYLLSVFYAAYRIKKKRARVAAALKDIEQREKQWSEENLKSIVHEKFLQLQQAWCSKDLGLIEKHLSPSLFQKWAKEINDQKERNETNVMENIIINDIGIVNAQNFINNSKDIFTALIEAKAKDQTFIEGELKSTAAESFKEFWTFIWCDDKWLLNDVAQEDKWQKIINKPIIDETKPKISAFFKT